MYRAYKGEEENPFEVRTKGRIRWNYEGIFENKWINNLLEIEMVKYGEEKTKREYPKIMESNLSDREKKTRLFHLWVEEMLSGHLPKNSFDDFMSYKPGETQPITLA